MESQKTPLRGKDQSASSPCLYPDGSEIPNLEFDRFCEYSQNNVRGGFPPELHLQSPASGTANNADRPWLDECGKIRPDSDLQTSSKHWSAETWDLFLTETVDRPPREEEVQFDGYSQLLDEAIETNWEFYGSLPSRVESQIRRSIKSLEKIKRKIIRGAFWLSLSTRSLARRLEISKSEVSRQKHSAQAELRTQLEILRDTASYLIGGSANLPLRERSRDQQILDVYRQNLNGSYMK